MPSGGVLFEDRDPLPLREVFVLRLGEEVGVVVDHLELETRGAADEILDLVERLLVEARDLDDDVLVARRDARLAEPLLVDAALNRLFRLRDGALANGRLDVAPDLEGDFVVARPHLRSQLLLELLEETLVDLRAVGDVRELQLDDRALGRGDVDDRVGLRQLFARHTRVAGVDLEERRELEPHLLGEVVPLVGDRVLYLDRVDEADAAAEIEAGRDAERDVVVDVFDELVRRELAAGVRVQDGRHRRRQGDERDEERRDDEADLRAPQAVHHRQGSDERPDADDARGDEPPEGVVAVE